jgi:hypothetical protein
LNKIVPNLKKPLGSLVLQGFPAALKGGLSPLKKDEDNFHKKTY